MDNDDYDEDEMSLEIEMTEWSCATCGVVSMMPEDFNIQLRKSGNTFWCLNGHANVYPVKKPESECKCKKYEECELKLMNEYSKNAQLEEKISKLSKKKSLFSIFGNKKNNHGKDETSRSKVQ